MRMQSDLAELCVAALAKQLHRRDIQWDLRTALGVVLATRGYPGQYERGQIIEGLPRQEHTMQKVFHAGTRLRGGQVLTNGGRVLCATALGDGIKAAQKRAYELVHNISWPDMFYRSDIGHRAIESE